MTKAFLPMTASPEFIKHHTAAQKLHTGPFTGKEASDGFTSEADVRGGEIVAKENAEFIVEACNTYYIFKKALMTICEQNVGDDNVSWRNEFLRAYKVASDALKNSGK